MCTWRKIYSRPRNDLHSLMRGFATLMPSLTGTKSHSRSINCIHENDKKRLYSRRVLDAEHGSFTPLVFTTTGGMGKECIRYHSRLTELIAVKKGEHYSETISWIRARTSSALLRFRSDLVCLRGWRVKRRIVFDYNNCDIEIAVAEGAIDINIV